jgi:16S rRNA C967 or C1407 C5-methylase (RsmB/RsmF family)
MNSIMRMMGRQEEESSTEEEKTPSIREKLAEEIVKRVREQYTNKSNKFIRNKTKKITLKFIMKDTVKQAVDFWTEKAPVDEQPTDALEVLKLILKSVTTSGIMVQRQCVCENSAVSEKITC